MASRSVIDILQPLLDRGGDDIETRSRYGETPLICASSNAMARWHIQLGFPEGLKLWPAYEARSITAIQLLLAAGACIDAQDNLGNTALHTSAWFGSWDTEGPVHGTCALVKTLLAAGADSTIRNNDGLTAEDMAEGEAKAVLVAHRERQMLRAVVADQEPAPPARRRL